MMYGGVPYVSTVVHRFQKRASDPLELELEVTVNHPMWLWEPGLRFPERAKESSLHLLSSNFIFHSPSEPRRQAFDPILQILKLRH